MPTSVVGNPNANYINDPRYASSQVVPQALSQQQYHHQHQQQQQMQHQAQLQQQQLSHDSRYYTGTIGCASLPSITVLTLSPVGAIPAAAAQPKPKPYGATNLGRCFRAIYDYTAQDIDEVSFMDGDLIIHCQPIDDGWMTGTVQRTGQTGMLPSNYVETA